MCREDSQPATHSPRKRKDEDYDYASYRQYRPIRAPFAPASESPLPATMDFYPQHRYLISYLSVRRF